MQCDSALEPKDEGDNDLPGFEFQEDENAPELRALSNKTGSPVWRFTDSKKEYFFIEIEKFLILLFKEYFDQYSSTQKCPQMDTST